MNPFILSGRSGEESYVIGRIRCQKPGLICQDAMENVLMGLRAFVNIILFIDVGGAL